jgi:glutamine---fructose-6-phosphate transaminase (isomerizing)
MCGIVGYIGPRSATDVLLGGLARLEYRGYDSAGVAVIENGQLAVARRVGKLINLKNALDSSPLHGRAGIGHTRWATHGRPSEENAHPHIDCTGQIAVVHNGIIENYATLKEKLKGEGVRFKSETDTEVLSHLIGKYYETGSSGDLAAAVRRALLEVEGTFGIAVVAFDNPNVLIGARKGSPLVVGVGENELFLASDASAIVNHTKRVIYLKDGHLIELKQNGEYHTVTLDNRCVNTEIQQLEWDAGSLAKGGFPHFMLKEIFEQPETIKNAMRGRLLLDEGASRLDGLNLVLPELRSIRRVILIGCGTSWHAALVGEYMIEQMAGIPVEVEYSSEFRYRNPIIDPHTMVFCISQSGETADTLAALREASHRGATVLGICNAVGSSIARETHGGVYLHAGPEIGVASTKAFTSQLTVLALLTLLLGRMRRISHTQGITIAKALSDIPKLAAKLLRQNDAIKTIAQHYYKYNNFMFLGRSHNFPVALEGALKLKEISYIHAEGYPAAEMKHGPIALIDKNMPTVVIVPRDSVYEKGISNIQEIRARGGQIIAVATEGDKNIKKHAQHVIYIPETLEMLTPLLAVIPLQLLAYHIAAKRGCSIDQPRNLAKSVTVE